jgi:4-aminobutyrate aminotransferase
MDRKNRVSEGDINDSPLREHWNHHVLDNTARQLLKRDADVFLHQSLSTPCLNVLSHSKGSTFTNVQGKEVLDFHGNYVHNLGFGHDAVREAIIKQMETLSFSTRRYTNLPAIELAEKLTGYTKTLKRALFVPGGAEAIGIALKIARLHTGRHKTISMWDSFHGASLDAASVGGEAVFRQGIGPLLPGTEHVPPANPSECPFNCGKICSLHCAGYVEYVLEKEGDVAAVVAETVRSAPFIPPVEYWQRIRQACDKHGALLILDEIPHALGRTGRMFTFQHYGIEPDIVVIGKGLGGGIFPLAAVLARDEFNDSVKDRSIGHYTHEKNPVSSAAALAMLTVVEDEHLLNHVRDMHTYAMKHMRSLQERHPIIYDVRGIGLLLGIELRNRETGEKAMDEAEAVMYYCLENGLNFKISMGCILNLTPPLNVSPDELDRAFSIIESGLEALK